MARRQKCWENVTSLVTATSLLDEAENNEERACLLAMSARESGAWLRAVPVSVLDLCMDDDMLRVAVGLHLGAPICGPHLQCRHWFSQLNQ